MITNTVAEGEILGRKLAEKRITTSQIRKFLSAVNTIQNKVRSNEAYFDLNEVKYLRIKLAYQAGREQKLIECFYHALNQKIELSHITNFMEVKIND